MRKFYSVIAIVAMMVVSVAAKAAVAAETLTSNLETVSSYFEGYAVYHYYNFKTMSRDGGEAQTFTIGTEAVDALMPVTTPDFENIMVAVGRGTTTNPDLRWRDANYGLYEFGSGARTLRIGGLAAGMIVVIQGAQGQSYDYFAAGVINAEMAVEITDSIHTIQTSQPAGENGEEPKADEYRYFQILKDGDFDFSVNRGCYILSLAILIDQSAGEAVSAPALKMVGVDGDSRQIEFKPGESTLGYPCSTWYGIVDSGEEALYLKDTEEIDHYEYTYDEEGVLVDSVPVYKQILDPEYADQGAYGDHQFNIEDGYVTISASDDEDGDGYVTVAAATVSESGAFSNVVLLNVSVGAISLNAPTLTLQGIEGVKRTYSVGWTSNTLCGEDYTIIVEGDNGNLYVENEPNTGIGTTYTFTENAKVTVKVAGYEDGVCELDEVDYKGIEIRRKNPATQVVEKVDADGNKYTEEVAKHDWDFVNLSESQNTIIKGEAVSGCYIVKPIDEEKNDTVYYSAEEYVIGEAADGTDLSGAVPVYATSCWSWDGSKARATLNVVSDTIGYEGIINDKNDNGYGYVVDDAKVFGEGLTVSCPPNSGNNSCILQYINGDLGMYFMSRPTLTFSRDVVKAGELVLIYQGAGGSNYTNWRSPLIVEAPADALCEVQLANGGIHVFYMDVYTYDELPADAVNSTSSVSAEVVAVYSVAGAKSSALQKGINIVKYSDGSVKKVLVK